MEPRSGSRGSVLGLLAVVVSAVSVLVLWRDRGVPGHVARIGDADRSAAGLCRDHEIIEASRDALTAADALVPSG